MEQNDDYAKKLLSATRLCAFCAVVVLILLLAAAVVLVPRALTAIDNLTFAADKVNAVDWQALADNVSKAADNLSKVDFDTLNQAISDLQRAIAPLAELFGG